MIPEHKYMLRCLQLAELGAGHVAPNPMVGAVLVVNDRIIGEGWHKQYGEAHAEVNCIGQATSGLTRNTKNHELITQSTLYVSLEPCSHYGKTPPCTDLIIQHRIPKIVIGCQDPFKEVNGSGIEKLRAAGVEVVLLEGPIADECRKLNKRFFTFHEKQRPYIILKWAQTKDGFMAPLSAEEKASPSPSQGGVLESNRPGESRLLISNEYSNRLVHQWRSEESAILVGTSTALLDDPELTNRWWNGPSPVRLVVDMDLRLPDNLKLFNGEQSTVIFNGQKSNTPDNLTAVELKKQKDNWFYKIDRSRPVLNEIIQALFQLEIQSILVEGGARLLHSFLSEGLWDEIRVITNEELMSGQGLPAPKFRNAVISSTEKILSDRIETYFRIADEHK